MIGFKVKEKWWTATSLIKEQTSLKGKSLNINFNTKVFSFGVKTQHGNMVILKQITTSQPLI